MTSPVAVAPNALAFAGLDAALDALLGVDATSPATDDLFDALRELDRFRNRLANLEHALVGEVDARQVCYEHGWPTTAGLLSALLNLTRHDGKQRVAAAAAAGPRLARTGEPLEPVFPLVAAAQADGSISPAHAALVVRTVDTLPSDVTATHGEAIEASLVEAARDLNPNDLARACEHLRQLYDPDGTLPDDTRREQQRELTLSRRADGSGRLTGELTTECAEYLDTVFDTLARPMPAAEGPNGPQPDPRSAAQRRHDALHDLCSMTIRAETLPECGGVATTVVVTLDEQAWRTGSGTAWTGHGYPMRADRAITMAGGDHRLLAVAMNSMRAITAHGATHRLFSRNQRCALAARDGGCTFPGCTVPAAWCEADHIKPFADSGPTSIDNGHLLCRFHHRWKDTQHWTVEMINGRPGWIPPQWIDALRRPRYNHVHRPVVATEPADDP